MLENPRMNPELKTGELQLAVDNLKTYFYTDGGVVRVRTEADHNGEPHDVIGITVDGWAWVDANESLFLIRRGQQEESGNEEQLYR